MNRRSVNTALAGSLAAAVVLLTAPVALKGQNDCAAGAHSCAGMSKVDYDGQSFKLVPAGSCTAMKTPKGAGKMEAFKS